VPAGVTLSTGVFALTINDGKAFKVDGIVDVPTGGTLTLGATGAGISELSYLAGTINVTGTLVDKKTSPKAAFWDGPRYYNNATPSTGKFVINATATVTPFTSLFTIASPASLSLRAGANVIANAGVYTYEIAGGTVTLNANRAIEKTEKLVVRTGSTLALDTKVFTGESDAQIASLVVFEGTAVSTGSSSALNFYPASSNTGAAAVAGTTYKWSATAGGDSTPGWKAQ
jgi:hypothetical protein